MEFFHVFNRGVDKRNIVLDNQDRARFVHDLYIMNNSYNVSNTVRMFDVGRRTFSQGFQYKKERIPLVRVHGWCLMRNHYHLLLSEIDTGGMSKFLKKLNMGYAKYFNERYKRSGTLFQGKTKKKHINNETYFLYILHYIHLNPLDYVNEASDWRDGNLNTTATQALTYLHEYRWSSFQDYCNKKNFPSIITTEPFDDIFKNYEKTLRKYLDEMRLSEINDLIFE